MDPRRTERIAEALREELSELIGYELSDPRVGDVHVTGVEVSPDLRLAVIRVAVHGSAADEVRALAALDHAKPFIKRKLAGRLDLFRLPDLRFEVGFAAQSQAKMRHLLRRIRRGRPKDNPLENSEKTQ